MGFHLCLVGWLDNGTAGYPTAYPNPSCGANRVGIVDYGTRSNLSETWDAFCYREKGEWHEHLPWKTSCLAQAKAVGTELPRGHIPSPHAHVGREHAEGHPEAKGAGVCAATMGTSKHSSMFLCRSGVHLPGRVCGRWVFLQRQTPRGARRPRSLLHILFRKQ